MTSPVAIASGKTLRFAPGGHHLMLFGLGPQLKPGARIPLAFRLEDGRILRAEARIIAPGADPGA